MNQKSGVKVGIRIAKAANHRKSLVSPSRDSTLTFDRVERYNIHLNFVQIKSKWAYLIMTTSSTSKRGASGHPGAVKETSMGCQRGSHLHQNETLLKYLRHFKTGDFEIKTGIDFA